MRQVDDLREAGWERDVARTPRHTRAWTTVSADPDDPRVADRGDRGGEVAHSPFTDAGRAELYEYLNQPAERGRRSG